MDGLEDFPAAHSMDTTWFVVDADDHVAVFDSGEAGLVPFDVDLLVISSPGECWQDRRYLSLLLLDNPDTIVGDALEEAAHLVREGAASPAPAPPEEPRGIGARLRAWWQRGINSQGHGRSDRERPRWYDQVVLLGVDPYESLWCEMAEAGTAAKLDLPEAGGAAVVLAEAWPGQLLDWHRQGLFEQALLVDEDLWHDDHAAQLGLYRYDGDFYDPNQTPGLASYQRCAPPPRLRPLDHFPEPIRGQINETMRLPLRFAEEEWIDLSRWAQCLGWGGDPVGPQDHGDET